MECSPGFLWDWDRPMYGYGSGSDLQVRWSREVMLPSSASKSPHPHMENKNMLAASLKGNSVSRSQGDKRVRSRCQGTHASSESPRERFPSSSWLLAPGGAGITLSPLGVLPVCLCPLLIRAPVILAKGPPTLV